MAFILTVKVSTTPRTSETNHESLQNPASELTVEEANRILSETVYEAEEAEGSYEISLESGEHVGTYQDIFEMAGDLLEMQDGFDGMYGSFENDGSLVIYGRAIGDNLVQSTEHVDLENMR